MYASLMISLLAAFVAMLGKQWLNRYLRNSGGSTIERCGDRQRKCDGLDKWPLHFFVESLPMMLQVSLLLLTSGLCRHMWSINASVARTLIGFTGLGVIFYIGIVIAGMSSYACPFQTPASIALRSIWNKVQGGAVSAVDHPKRLLSWIHRMWNRRALLLLRRQSLPPLEDVQVQQPEPPSTLDNVPQSEWWLKSKELDVIRRKNNSDAQCVSWILRNITDPEALDIAVRLAGEVRWFDDRSNADLPYDVIVSTFEACFDSTRTLYPGSRDRAYYSGRAMMWIHTLADCKSKEVANRFPLPDAEYITAVPDPDLEQLLQANFVARDANRYIDQLLEINPGHTPSHSQWISNLLLHHSWANQTELDYERILYCVPGTHETKITIPLNATLNRLLVCSLLGSSIEEEALKVRDKSYEIFCCRLSSCSPIFTSDRIEQILDRLSKLDLSAVSDTEAKRKFIPYVLGNLIKLETRTECLTKMAYGWCSVIYENRRGLQDWENLLRICLEIGFRHLDFQCRSIEAVLTHTEHHRGLVDAVFESQKGEVIADLLHAWTAESKSDQPARALLGLCAEHLVRLPNLAPFPPRLRRLVTRSVELIGYKGFEEVGVEGLIGLLDRLHVTVEDMDDKSVWAKLLLETFQTPEGAQHLSHWYWELLVDLTISLPWLPQDRPAYSPRIMEFLTDAQEWSKLEYWIGIVWMLWPLGAGGMTREDVENSTRLLFHQRPGATQKLEQWIERWSRGPVNHIPDSFRLVCERAREAAQQNTP
jgi:hypothetical protein